VIWVEPTGKRRAGRIALGLPAPHPKGDWACLAFVDANSGRRFTIIGVDSWQAMMLALQFIGYELHHFTRVGGRALYPKEHDDDEGDVEFDLTSVLGPLVRSPPPT
jgi:hypothetical protein